MEQRKKTGILIGILLILTVIPCQWYLNLDKVEVFTEKNTTDLSKTEKIDKFGFVNVDTYEAFYQNEVTYQQTRTLIPFVWDTKVLNTTPTKLYTR